MTSPAPQIPIESFLDDSPKPKKSGFAIKALMGIVILVILSEVGYLAYNNFFKPSESLSGPSITSEDIVASPEEITLDNITPDSPTTKPNQKQEKNINNINQDILYVFSSLTSNKELSFKNASTSFSLEGTVHDSFLEEISSNPYKLIINHEDEIISLEFSSKELLSAKVKDNKRPNEKLSLLDIRTGDNIIISITTNLINNLDGYSRVQIDIIDRI